jgi:hypothetical protein
MKFGRLAVALSLLLTFAQTPRVARAEGGEAAPAGGHERPGEGASHGIEGYNPVENSNTTVAGGERGTWIGNLPNEASSQAPKGNYAGYATRDGATGAWHGDPVIGQNAAGRNTVLSDPSRPNMRGTPFASKEMVAVNTEHQENFEAPKGVTLVSTSGKGAVGLNAGPFKDGRAVLTPENPYGEIAVDVLRVDAQGSAGAGIGNGNVQAQAGGKVTAVLVGISAESHTFGLGDPNGLNNALVKGEARAFVGGELEGNAAVHAGLDGAGGSFNGKAMIGARAEATGFTTVTICGVQVNLTGVVYAQAGAGAEASGAFDVNFKTGTVKIGLKAGAAVGLGAGAGGTVEISLAQVLKDPGAAAQCVADGLLAAGKFVVEKGGELVDGAVALAGQGIDALGRGVDAVADAVSSTVSNVASALCFWCDDPPPPRIVATTLGNNATRNSNTTGRGGPNTALTATPSIRAGFKRK